MWSILIPATDALVAACWELGTAGLLTEPDGMRAFFVDSLDPGSVCSQLQLPPLPVRQEAESSASDFDTSDWDPILIGRRFFVAPPWVTRTTPSGRIRLTLHASSAFGSGAHETTQLAIEAMEDLVTSQTVVVDIGCGSGILSMVAAALGAASVFSCDIQQAIVEAAGLHVQTPLFVGSADSVQSARADLTVANISAAALDRLAWHLQRITKPTGRLILSGFIHEKQPQYFKPLHVSRKGDWLCWICEPLPLADLPATPPMRHPQEWWL